MIPAQEHLAGAAQRGARHMDRLCTLAGNEGQPADAVRTTRSIPKLLGTTFCGLPIPTGSSLPQGVRSFNFAKIPPNHLVMSQNMVPVV